MIEITDQHRIEQLLERFFDASTTRAEERELEAYFTSGRQLPDYLAPYREMFGWYASGMPDEELTDERAVISPVGLPPQREKRPRRDSIRWITWWTSAAAVAALIIGFGWHHHAERLEGMEMMFAESYVIRDGLVITGQAEVQPEIDAALLEMELLEMELEEAQYSLQNNDNGL